MEDLPDNLNERLSEALEEPVSVQAATLLSGGACQVNHRLDLEDGRRMVLRADAAGSLPGSISRRAEFRVLTRAVARGVRTPRPLAFLSDFPEPDRDALLTEWHEGEALGRRILRSPELADVRPRLGAALATELARIHTLKPAEAPQMLASPPDDPLETALVFVERMLDRLPVDRPACTLVYRWLVANRPGAGSPVLVHGDYRLGNFLVTPQGLEAILDWEFAHWGDRHEDLGWLAVRDWRFGNLTRPVAGLCSRQAFYDAYEAAQGLPVDPERAHWWEVYGNLRWAAGSLFQTDRVLSGGERDLELLAIGRRAAEMEFEAMRLIERGPAR